MLRAVRSGDRILQIPVAAQSKAWACDRSYAGITGSNLAVLCVLYGKDKVIRTENVRRENKRRTFKKNKNISVGARFPAPVHTDRGAPPSLLYSG